MNGREMGVSENRGSQNSTLNSRVLNKIKVPPIFGNSQMACYVYPRLAVDTTITYLLAEYPGGTRG